jgi:DDE superfamily endonuclease
MGVSTALASGCVPCLVLDPSSALTSRRTSWLKPKPSCADARSGSNSDNGPTWPSSCTSDPSSRIPRRRLACNCTPTPSGPGGDAGPKATSPWRISPDGVARPSFPPRDEAIVKALACETVAQTKLPLSRQSLGDLATRAHHALGKPISRSTVWRILAADAIKPWRYEYWIFPRDPRFAEKAGMVLDLYAGTWQGQRLGPKDHILSADEKTSIQARVRVHPSLGPAPGRSLRVEHEYGRGGALPYLAAWDVRRGYVMGRREPKTGIVPFSRLVAQVMERPPYRSADRVFWVVDNGSSHRGEASAKRLAKAYSNLILVHTPVHASWLNQVEIYFSLVQRKVLTPNDFASLDEVEERLRFYETLTNGEPRPFQWKFDRDKLAAFLERLEKKRHATEVA